MVLPAYLAKIAVPAVAGAAAAATTFEIGPNLGTVLTALINAVAAALIGHALRKRASAALEANESRAKRRKSRRHSTPENQGENQP